MVFAMMGMKNTQKRYFVAMASVVGIFVISHKFLPNKISSGVYLLVNGRLTDNLRDERAITQSGRAQANLDSSKLVDNAQVDGDCTTEWDMFDSDHVDVALFSCNINWARRMNIYRTVKCNETRRTISIRKTLGNVTAASSADVIIFGRGVGSLKNLQLLQELRKKKPHQIWLHTTPESAYLAPPAFDHYTSRVDPRFNMSYCYHPKAEIVSPFGAYIRGLMDEADKGRTKITPKPDIPVLAAWASSHCDHTFWNRTGLVRELSKYLPIDLFGACGVRRIPRNESGSEILKNYKFYIAFENSCCSYYITEKFWKALGEYESVPIVIGSSKSEYESIAPPNSFVFADDFNSMEDLASYIKEVAKDEALYNKFHEWRKYGKAEVYTSRLVWPFVEDQNVCRLLNYLEMYAWRKDHPLHMQMDPYGTDWAGSCISCGNHRWLKDYGLASKNFSKRVNSL